VAVGYTSYQPVLAIRHNDPNGLDLGISNRLLFNDKNSDTHYRSGTAYVADFIGGWNFGKWKVGVTGSYLNQFTDDRQNGTDITGNRTRSFAMGPTVAYNAGTFSINMNCSAACTPPTRPRAMPSGSTSPCRCGWAGGTESTQPLIRITHHQRSYTMFRYFPTNYVWNLSVDLAIEMGARIGEIEAMCAPCKRRPSSLTPKAPPPSAPPGRTWQKSCAAWPPRTKRAAGCSRPGQVQARRQLPADLRTPAGHGAPGRLELYRRFLEVFQRGITLAGENCERVEIPYEGKVISGCIPAPAMCRGRPDAGPAQWPGFDQGNEIPGRPARLAGRARRLLAGDRPARHRRSPAPARPDRALRCRALGAPRGGLAGTARRRRPSRIGCEGVSLGGYYCPRVVAMEPRFACGVVWGANHDWRDVQKRAWKRGRLPVPHYWQHVCWVWGAKDVDDFMRIAEDVHLDGVVEKIRVPFLVTHGEKDSRFR
jgi:hypothetical protein